MEGALEKPTALNGVERPADNVVELARMEPFIDPSDEESTYRARSYYCRRWGGSGEVWMMFDAKVI